MHHELFWLTLTALLTALIWVPYILNRLGEVGILPAIMDSNADTTPTALWAKRLMRAHANAVENLVIFAPLALTIHVLQISSALTVTAAATYFFARVTHVVVYALGIPVVRTLSFALGVCCQVVLALEILKAL